MKPKLTKIIGWNLLMIAACAITLYPVLWVIKMALTPSQAFCLSPNPFPDWHPPPLGSHSRLLPHKPFHALSFLAKRLA